MTFSGLILHRLLLKWQKHSENARIQVEHQQLFLLQEVDISIWSPNNMILLCKIIYDNLKISLNCYSFPNIGGTAFVWL